MKLEELTALISRSVKEILWDNQEKRISREQEIRKILEGKQPIGTLGRLLYEEKQNYPREIVVAVVRRNKIYGEKWEKTSIEWEDACGENTRLLFAEAAGAVFIEGISSRRDRLEYSQNLHSRLRAMNYGVGTYCMGVSGRGTMTEICQLHEQAQEALRHRMYLKNAGCIFYDTLPGTKEPIYPLLHFDKRSMKESISTLQMDYVKELICNQFDYLYEKKCTNKQAAAELCMAIKNAVFDVMKEKGVDIEGILDSNQEMFQRQMEFSSLDSYKAWICDYCHLLLCGLQDLSGKRYSSVISRAVDYINQHYKEDITLRGLAEEVNKSTSYFSCIFKKQMGVNFNEYLNQVRVRKAKELLRMPDAVIYEIAEQTGFHDYKYFAKVFRKQCGCSPSDYSRRRNFEES